MDEAASEACGFRAKASSATSSTSPSGLLKQSGEDRLRMVGIKIFMCGSVSGETAFL